MWNDNHSEQLAAEPTLWLKTGATRSINAKHRAYWVFDQEGRLRPLPVNTGLKPWQLNIDYLRDGDTILGIRSVSVNAKALAMGYRSADEIFARCESEAKKKAFEILKQSFDRGENRGLPPEYMPQEVIDLVATRADSRRAELELPPLEDDGPKRGRPKKVTEPSE